MRFSLPSMDCLVNSPEHGVPEMKPHNSSLELDEFTFHLALVGSITQLLLTSPEDIPTGDREIKIS